MHLFDILKLHIPFWVDDVIFTYGLLQTFESLLFVYFTWEIICDFVLLMCGNLFSKIIAFVEKVTSK